MRAMYAANPETYGSHRKIETKNSSSHGRGDYWLLYILPSLFLRTKTKLSCEWLCLLNSLLATLSDAATRILAGQCVIQRLMQVIASSCVLTMSVFPGVTSYICSVRNLAVVAPCHSTTLDGRLFGKSLGPAPSSRGFFFLSFP